MCVNIFFLFFFRVDAKARCQYFFRLELSKIVAYALLYVFNKTFKVITVLYCDNFKVDVK